MRTYSKIDLLRFHNFSKAHPELSPTERIHLYDVTFKEISEEEKLKNMSNFITKYAEMLERKDKK